MIDNYGDDFDANEPTPLVEHMTKIGKTGGLKTKERYGPEYYKIIGQKGGSANKAKRDPEYFRELGRKGGQARWAKLRQEVISGE